MTSGAVDDAGVEDGADAAAGRKADIAFDASVVAVVAVLAGIGLFFAAVFLESWLGDPANGGGGTAFGLVLAFIGFLASNVTGLVAWARLRRRSWWRWLVVLPVRSWALLWGSLLMLWVVTSVAPGTVVSSEDGYERTVFGWPRPWIAQELPDTNPGAERPSLHSDAINGDMYVHGFWADWYVATLILLGLAVLARLLFRLVADGAGRHRVARGGPPQDGGVRTSGEPAVER